MKCPNCHHDKQDQNHWCRACANVFAYTPTETWNHLDYMLTWLQEQQPILGDVAYRKLRQDLLARQTQLEITLHIPELQAAREAATVVEPEPIVTEKALQFIPVTAEEPLKAARPTAVSSPIIPPARPKPAPAPKKKAKPVVKRPSIDWGKAWDKVVAAAVSGALLTGLLYLGAFMIVVAAGVLAISFWDSFPTILQLFLIALVPSTFYIFGWLTRWKLALKQAGGVLTGIGALLVAVDFAAVYQFGDLGARGIDLTLYWFVASLICIVIYALTAWRLPSEFFGYITLLGLTSALVALVLLIGLPFAWTAAAVALSAILMIGIGVGLEKEPVRWPNLAKSTRRLPILALPLSQIVVLLMPDALSFASAATFVLAAVGYGLLAWRQPLTLWPHAAVWSSAAAFGSGWVAAELPLEWAATGIVLLAALYIFAGWGLRRQLSDTYSKKKAAITAVNLAGFSLLFVAILGGLITIAYEYITVTVVNIWPGITALVLSVIVLAGCAVLYRKPRFIAAASGLFLMPFTIFTIHLLTQADLSQWAAWLMLAWVGLALVYMGLTVLIGHWQKTIPYVVYLNLWAQLLLPAALFGLILNYNLVHIIPNRIGFDATPTLVVLAAAILFYMIAALLHHRRHPALTPAVTRLMADLERPLFLWPIGLLIAVWLAVAWFGSVFTDAWLGVALAGLGLAYVAAGELLGRIHPSYRLPWHTYAYLLALTGILAALGDSYPLIFTLLLTVILLGLLSYLYQRVYETAAAGLLFLWPVWLLLELTHWNPHSYTLVYMLLAALAYVPLGIWLWRKGADVVWRPQALALLIIGYVVAVAAVLDSTITSMFSTGNWISVAVPLIGTALALYSLYYFRKVQVVKRPFAWASVLLTILTYAELSVLLNIPPAYMALAWVSFAFALMLVERLLTLRLSTSVFNFKWALPMELPLNVSAIVLWMVGMGLTLPETIPALMGNWQADLLAPILAQTVGVIMLILTAWLYRSRWPLFLEPAVAFFPVTLFFIAYGERMLGQPLTTSQFAYVWLGLALAHLVTAVFLDNHPIRYAHGLYLGGYGLLLLALMWSIPDRVVTLVVLGMTIVVALVSQGLVHNGRYHTFNDFARLIWRKEGTLPQRTSQALFLFLGVYAFPVWLVLLLAQFNVAVAWWGMALALLAPLYVAAGLISRRTKDVYAWPFYSAGYALTGIGAMLAFNDVRLTIVVLSLNTVVYAASTVIFRQPFWLYLSAVLIPVVSLLILYQNETLTHSWVAGLFMAMAFLYIGLGTLLNRHNEKTKEVSPYALPFYGVGYLLSAVALAAGSSERMVAIVVYTAGVALYLLSVWLFKEAIFYYPAAWLAAVPYYLLMTLTPLPQRWLGLSWLPLIVLYVVIGRFVFTRQQPEKWRSSVALTAPSLPFYLLAYVLSISMMVLSQADPLTFTLSLAAASLLYFVSAGLFQHPAWLYPGLFTAQVALAAYFTINPSDSPTSMISIPFLAATWAVALAGYWFSREFPVVHKLPGGERVFSFYRWQFHFGDWPFLGYLLTPSWAQPFFLFTVLDIVVWQLVALGMAETAVFFASGIFLLLSLFAMLWRDKALPVGAIAFFLLAVVVRLGAMDMRFGTMMAWLGGIGLGCYLLARIIARITHEEPQHRLSLWTKPLTGTAVFLTGFTAFVTLPLVVTYTTATALCLAFAGGLYLAIAYRGNYQTLGYAAAAVLQLAWILLLISQEIRQPQLYAIPAGFYFIGVGILERKRGRYLFACYLEGFGFTIILLTSFIQSLNPDGFYYFLLLLVESLLVIWTSAVRHVKIPFFIGISFSVLNVVAQLIILVNVYDINRWLVILGTGVLLIIIGIFVERRRENIIDTAHEWKEALGTWH